MEGKMNLDWELTKAVLDGDLGKAESLFKGGAKAAYRDLYGRHLIYSTIESNKLSADDRLRMVQLLLNNGADSELDDINKMVPLVGLASNPSLDSRILGILIDKGIEKNLSVLGLSLMLTAEGFDPSNVKSIEYDTRDWNLLHYAAYNGKLNVVQEIFKLPIEKRGGINDQNAIGWTPLHLAISYNRKDMVGFLIDQGANIGAKANPPSNKTPLDLANAPERSEIASLLRAKQSEYDNLLLTAVHNGDISKVTDLLNRGANIEAKGTKNETSLCVASNIGRSDIIELLLSKGASVNVRDIDGKTPLHYAAFTGKGVELILSKGASIEAKDKNGWTPLHYAAWQNRLNAARLLVDKGANIGAKGNDGKVPLIVASETGKVEVANFLRSKQSEYDNLLLTAVHNGDISKVTDLLNRGANIEAKGTKNQTPLCVASNIGKLDMIQLLLGNGAKVNVQDIDGKTPLHYAALIGKGVELILSKGASIEAKDSNKCTPLHCAALEGQLNVAEFLIAKGANINETCNTDLRKPIHIAAMKGNKDIIDLLISKGVNVDDTSKSGWTPLHYAAWQNRLNAARLLVDKGANIGAKGNDGKVPLIVASETGKVEVANFLRSKQSEYDNLLLTAVHNGDISKVTDLLNRGANVNARDVYAWTPLHYAAQEKKLDIVNLLLYKGADVNAKSYGDVTPLHCAAWAGDIDIMEKLFNKGAVRSSDKGGDTPLGIAMKRNFSKSVINFLWGKGGNVPYGDGVYYTWYYNARIYSSLRKHDLRRDRAPRTKREVYTFLAGQHTSLHDEVMTEPLLDGGGNIIGAESSDNDQMGYNKAKSKASKSSSWIGASQFISYPFRPAIDMKHSQPSKAITAQGIDTSGTLLLLDIFIRKITGQKYISTTDQPMTLLEARGYALNITTEFKKVLKDTAKRSGVLVNESSFNYFKTYQAIEGKMISGELSKIPTILYSAIEEAYPKNEKFLSILKGNIERMLDRQKVVNCVRSSNQVPNIVGVSDKIPLSSLNNIAIEPVNGKKGVTFAGRVG
ncbi:ANK_REP_REGION domain-containing protein [Trichonephila clavata]|uniref:Alpha-latrotoxin n=1 Tax=Trichonephila clavata TaxID=2740835 RepID=A0A8X6GJN1_TRICU|nr:ANK_REP_REGION domain-containing protein [Trichonephila clavata]